MSSDRFSANPHRQDHFIVLDGILDSSGLAAIFTRLEPAELLYMECFAGKSPGDASRLYGCLILNMSIHRHGIGPARDSIHLRDLPLILPPGGCSGTKFHLRLNRRTVNTTTNQYFSGLPNASIL
jgi:hypothetical protein